MKLNKKDNIRLMRECCIVKEIECTQHGKELEAQEFKLLRKTIQNSKNLSFEDLKEAYSDSSFSIKGFINQMETYKNSTLNRSYYKKALEAAKEYYSSFENSEKEEFNSKLRDQFFNENRISNLRVRLNRQHAKFIGGATITALLAAGALVLTHPDGDTKPEPTPTPIETQTPTNTPETNQTSIAAINAIDVNDKDFYYRLMDNFEELYTNEYNKLNDNAISPNDFSLDFSNQDYIFQVKLGEEYRYVSHGEKPDMIEKYLKDKNIPYETIKNISSASIYATNSEGDHEKVQNEFGFLTDQKIDSIAWVKNPYVKENETICVRLFDGNNPEDLLNTKNSPDSALTKLQAPVEVLSTRVGTDNKSLKNNYIEAVNEYENSELGLNCAVENAIDEQLIEEEQKSSNEGFEPGD